jgi:hypothetical protein
MQLGIVAVDTISRQRGATARLHEAAPGSRQVVVRETVKVEVPRKEGMVRIEVRWGRSYSLTVPCGAGPGSPGIQLALLTCLRRHRLCL